MIPHISSSSTRTNSPNYQQTFLTLVSLLLGLLTVVIASAFIQTNGDTACQNTEPERVFRICKWITAPDGSRSRSFKTAGLLAPEIKENLGTSVEDAARFMVWPEQVELSDFRQITTTQHWAFADPAILQIFDIQSIRGDLSTALTIPGQLILSERYAKKLFGSANPLGKTLLGLGGKIYTVSAVVENMPAQATLQFDVMASWASTLENSGLHEFSFMQNWTAHLVETFVRLPDPKQVEQVQTAILQLTERSPNPAGFTDLFLQPVSGRSPKTGDALSPDQARFGSGIGCSGPNQLVLMSKSWFM